MSEGPFLALDATASALRRWPEDRTGVLAFDISLNARPDVRGTCAALPFRDGAFDTVWCDPPHLVGRPDGAWARGIRSGTDAKFQRFSAWPSMKAWRDAAQAWGREFHRVLKPRGLLRWKVMDGSRSHGRVIDWRVVLDIEGFEFVGDMPALSQGPLSKINAKRWGSTPSLVHYPILRRLP